MISFDIHLTCINSVKQLVRAADHIACPVTIACGSQMIDGHSIMGILSMDLATPVTVRVDGTKEQAGTLRNAVSAYLV